MALSHDLISQFAKVINNDKKAKNESTSYGTTVEYNGSTYVKLDGSDLLTPVETTADTKPGERVTVLIKDHTATVTGNLSSPAARKGDVEEIGNKISEVEILVADKVSAEQLEVEKGRIDNLVTENLRIKDHLEASDAEIGTLQSDYVVVNEKLTAHDAAIENLDAKKIDAEIVESTYATIENLEATNVKVSNLESTYGEFEDLTTKKFTAIDADIKKLDTEKLSATTADAKYATIDFSNIGTAAIEKLFSDSGIIGDLVVSEGHITGKLVGVTIVGDLIEGGTVKADKLVVLGEDGLYYKLNTNGVTTTAEQTEYNSLNGSVITAKTITAEKVKVDDLVAFDATIGGFNITNSSIYSGAKESVTNTTRGIYLDKNGQISFGDADNYIRYYKASDGTYKLEISANSVSIKSESGSSSLDESLDELNDKVEALKNDVLTVRQSTEANIEINSQAITQQYSEIKSMEETIKNMDGQVKDVTAKVAATDGYIKTGKIAEDENQNPIYGVEIGQTKEDLEFSVFARFTPEKLSFYDGHGNEISYFSGQKLHIKEAVVLSAMNLGGYEISTKNGLTLKWAGR